MRYYCPSSDTIHDEKPEEYSIPLTEHHSTEPSTAIVDNFQFVWDTVSLSALKTCPRKYKYSILDGWTPKLRPPALAFGIAFHKCIEVWHTLRAQSHPVPDLRTIKLAGLMGETIPPGDPVRTKETLLRSVAWYIDQYQDDHATTVVLLDGTPAVEYSILLPFEEIDGIQTYLAGHVDRIVEFSGEIFLTDYKTTKRGIDHQFVEQFKPNGQLKHYLLALYVITTEGSSLPDFPAGALIDAIQLGVTFTRFQRFPIHYSRAEVEEYAADTHSWISLAHHFATTGNWPMNEESCDKYAGCTFRNICQQSPTHRQMYLESNFRQQTWDPLVER